MTKTVKKYKVYKRIAPDGRIYVGCTAQTLIKRSGADGSGYRDNVELWEAIQKFGWDNFVSEILLETEDAELAAETETKYIKKYNTTDSRYGFNKRIQTYITDDDYSERLSKAIKEGTTEESRKQRSESIRRFYANPENREFHRQRIRRTLAKPEVRERLIQAIERNNAKPEVRQKIRESVLRYWTEERKEQSELSRQRLAPTEVRSRISEGTKRGLASPEVREKMSEAQKTKWADPEYHARTQAAMKAACNTEEHRKNVSKAQKVAQNRPEVKAKISAAFSGLVFINNGVKNKRVKEAEVEHYVATGDWVRGKLPMGPRGPIDKLKNRTWIHKDGKAIMVPGIELQSYLDSGWVRGRGKLKGGKE
jgi:hypothetical protein